MVCCVLVFYSFLNYNAQLCVPVLVEHTHKHYAPTHTHTSIHTHVFTFTTNATTGVSYTNPWPHQALIWPHFKQGY